MLNLRGLFFCQVLPSLHRASEALLERPGFLVSPLTKVFLPWLFSLVVQLSLVDRLCFTPVSWRQSDLWDLTGVFLRLCLGGPPGIFYLMCLSRFCWSFNYVSSALRHRRRHSIITLLMTEVFLVSRVASSDWRWPPHPRWSQRRSAWNTTWLLIKFCCDLGQDSLKISVVPADLQLSSQLLCFILARFSPSVPENAWNTSKTWCKLHLWAECFCCCSNLLLLITSWDTAAASRNHQSDSALSLHRVWHI